MNPTATLSKHCVPNIGPRGRARRLRFGLLALLFAGLLLAALWGLGLSRWWRLLLFMPLAIAGTGFFQALQRTCIALAASGQIDLDDGPRPVTNPEDQRQFSAQGRTVQLQTLAFAVTLTALALLLP